MLYSVVFYTLNNSLKFVSVHKTDNIHYDDDSKKYVNIHKDFDYSFVSHGFDDLNEAIIKAKLFELNRSNLIYVPPFEE